MIDDEKLKNLKDEYEKIEMDKKGVDIMKENIEKAKKEEKRNLKKGLMIAGIGAVVVFAVPNLSPSVAMAMQDIPIISSIVDFITIRDFSDKESNTNVEMPIAQDENLTNLNKATEDYIKELIENFKAEFTKGDNKSLDITYDILKDNDKLLSLRINGLEVGASGYMYSKIYNVDKNNGAILELKDIFKDNIDYVAILSENIKTQMKEQMAQDENKIYFIEQDIPSGNFEKIKDNQNFYFNSQNELVICFDEYEVAPGYMGTIEFTITNEVTKDILK